MLKKNIALNLVQIPAGQFWMGAKDDEQGDRDELPRHQVSVGSFLMGANSSYPRTVGYCR